MCLALTQSRTTNLSTKDCVVMLEEGIHERIVGTIFECTEHHQTITTFWSLLQAYSAIDTLYKTDHAEQFGLCVFRA